MPTKSKAKASKGLNKKQLAHLEKRLLEERARVMKELGYYDESFNSSLQASDGDLSSYSFHMADQGTDAMEREKAFLFASQEGRYLWHVNQALRRLYQTPEKFGKCEQCGEDIGFDRLDALPHARLCIKCKAKEEDGKRRRRSWWPTSSLNCSPSRCWRAISPCRCWATTCSSGSSTTSAPPSGSAWAPTRAGSSSGSPSRRCSCCARWCARRGRATGSASSRSRSC